MLIAEVEPDHLEVERARPGDLLQPQHVAVEPPADFEVRDEDRDVVDLRHFKPCHRHLRLLIHEAPSRASSSSRVRPRTRNFLSRLVCPESNTISLRLTPRRSRSTSTMASLARPS